MNHYIENNRNLWDQWTRLHLDPGSEYIEQIQRFRDGEIILDDIELGEMGDVAGKSLLHLQCHLGLGALSWSRKGARVTGVDFSEGSIAFARALSESTLTPAQFICSDLYELPSRLEGKFDIVFTSNGVLYWLPDLERWAQVVASFLKPGGTFYILEFHPVRRILLPPRIDGAGKPVEWEYFPCPEPMVVAEKGSYANPQAEQVQNACYWFHSLGEIVTALCSVGLKLEYLHEFPKVVENIRTYVETEPGMFQQETRQGVSVPRLFSIRATL